ncbi:unnamed protein product [Arctia plantaginis]|uniref:Uncharacterized protein n=1 Tax=Arctia plantaginis TaxID=874455 RepID=A0A8S0ZIA6_ARCPL|nr:unnamed protein product [Arctia plantaginis]
MGVMDSEAGTGEVTIGVGVSEVGVSEVGVSEVGVGVAGVGNPGIDADSKACQGDDRHHVAHLAFVWRYRLPCCHVIACHAHHDHHGHHVHHGHHDHY